MVLRSYQYYAVEEIFDRVKNSNKNGYIWHTTGSGKTLTSFISSQILKKISDIKKIVFKCSEKDVFNVIERNNFNDFISSIEAKKIELNALDYMFENARKSLTNDALDKLNNLYNELR